MKKSESLEGIITRIQEIKEKYYRELKKEIEKKGIKIPSSSSIFITDSEVRFLEEFAEMNKLVDTKRIWKKYEKLTAKTLPPLPPTLATNGRLE